MKFKLSVVSIRCRDDTETFESRDGEETETLKWDETEMLIKMSRDRDVRDRDYNPGVVRDRELNVHSMSSRQRDPINDQLE